MPAQRIVPRMYVFLRPTQWLDWPGPSLTPRRLLDCCRKPSDLHSAAQDVGCAESQLFRLLGQPLTARQGFAWQPGGSSSLHRGTDANPGGGQEAFRTPGFRLHLGVQALRFLVALTKVCRVMGAAGRPDC